VDPLPEGVDALWVRAGEGALVVRAPDPAVGLEHSLDSRGGSVFVTSQPLILTGELLRSDPRCRAGMAHWRVEPTTAAPLEEDWVFVLQVGAKGRGWRTLEPPPGYKFHSITGIRVDESGPWLTALVEACRYQAAGEEGEVSRHCEYVRRWAHGHGLSLRLMPFPAWPEWRAAAHQQDYSIELVDHDGTRLHSLD